MRGVIDLWLIWKFSSIIDIMLAPSWEYLGLLRGQSKFKAAFKEFKEGKGSRELPRRVSRCLVRRLVLLADLGGRGLRFH